MNSRHGPVIVILMFSLALGAGIVAGKLTSRGSAPPPAQEGRSLSEVLELSPEQRAQMQKIWEDVSRTSHECLDEARQVQRDQDARLMSMLTPEQQAEYKRLTIENEGKIKVIDARRKRAFDAAVQRTLPILDDRQRQLYRNLIADRGLLPEGAGESATQPAQ